jgi:hypothetical protein
VVDPQTDAIELDKGQDSLNTRLFYTLLAVQALFAAGLIAVGLRSREDRLVEYLELTRRITSGQAKADDFLKLSSKTAAEADAVTVRSLFGPPLQRATELDVTGSDGKPEHRSGNYWIYYPADAEGRPIDFDALAKLSGPVQCFVVAFDAKGRARGEMLSVVHPIR